MATPQRSQDQERAAFAWNCVQDTSKEYAKLAKGAPALVMGNGLMQALAFWESKGKVEQQLCKHACTWLAPLVGLAPGAGFPAVMKALHGSSAETYLRATEETLEILRWIRQLASAVQREGG